MAINPEDFQDCESCQWFLERYCLEDLYTFYNTLRERYCVLNIPYAKVKNQYEDSDSLYYERKT